MQHSRSLLRLQLLLAVLWVARSAVWHFTSSFFLHSLQRVVVSLVGALSTFLAAPSWTCLGSTQRLCTLGLQLLLSLFSLGLLLAPCGALLALVLAAYTVLLHSWLAASLCHSSCIGCCWQFVVPSVHRAASSLARWCIVSLWVWS